MPVIETKYEFTPGQRVYWLDQQVEIVKVASSVIANSAFEPGRMFYNDTYLVRFGDGTLSEISGGALSTHPKVYDPVSLIWRSTP